MRPLAAGIVKNGCNQNVNICAAFRIPVLQCNRCTVHGAVSPPSLLLFHCTINAAVHFALRNNAISGRCELIPETRWLFNLHGSVLTANDSSLFNYYCRASDVQIGNTRWNAMGAQYLGARCSFIQQWSVTYLETRENTDKRNRHVMYSK